MSHPGRPNTEHELPKDAPAPTIAPPPYSPRQGRNRAALTARGVQLNQFAQRLALEPSTAGLSRAISAQLMNENETIDDDDEPCAPLSLRINTSITINKSNNIICLSETPSSHANAIAEAMTQAIKKYSAGNCGIPMIDGNGNPRPIRLEVDAGTVVEGEGNVIGSEDVILKVLRQRDEQHEQKKVCLRRPRAEDEEGESSSDAKRRRSE
ncbi:unnamed protein product [Clonostachys solani]|uniref:Uncharacterized protein n=1 Tax=Clonostachys solani TaxID=160281 RepID=A0A9N9Z622_9HYPO|nr:unnamed protein product [Clonostachys solani]